MGQSLALLKNIGSFVGIFIPVVASLIIITWGYNLLFPLAFILVILSLIPIIGLQDKETHFEFTYKRIKETVLNNKMYILPEIIDNIAEDSRVVLTLFVFISGLTILDLGILGTLGVLLGIVATYYTGMLTDMWNKETVLRIGAVCVSISLFATFLVGEFMPTPFLLYLVTLAGGIALKIFTISYGSFMYNRARGDEAHFLVLREIPNILGRTILYSSCAVFYMHLPFIFLIIGIIFIYFWFVSLKPLK